MTTAIVANLQLIYVSDIARSTTFYQQLFAANPVFTSPQYVAFAGSGDALFALWSGTAPDTAAPPRGEIGIMLPNGSAVAALYTRWQQDRSLTIISPLREEPYSQTFVLADPDGHLIRVCQRD